ncbi:hypothetical protein [Micromonospora chersina]|uniref:hypothetical protein n=1 Tax=Micromonospora chersina TaxID=47854 RepID=UPI003D8AB649
MSRPDRWWRPTTRRRPAQRARQRRMYSEQELLATFDTAYECGKGDERRRWQHDDLLDVADATGVTPMDGVGGADLTDEVERWLREQ